MAVCLEYQFVEAPRQSVLIPFRIQLLAVLFLALALAVKLWTKVETTNLGYEYSRLQREMVTLDMERRELTLQRSVLLRPDALARAAHSRLQLETLDPTRTRRVPEP